MGCTRARRAIQAGFIVILVAAAMSGQGAAAADGPREKALVLEQQGKDADAEDAWRAILKAHPADAEPYAHLGVLEARQKRYKEAAADYRKALAIGPRLPALRLNLGLALFKGGDLKGAIQEFQPLLKEAPESSPDNLRLSILIGMAHYGLGEYAEAVPYLKSASDRDQNNLSLLLALAHSYLWSKQFKYVMDVYQEILTLNAESAEADMLAGEALDEMKDSDGAIKMFRSAIAASPNDQYAHFGLGYLLMIQKRFADAVPEFKADLEIAPSQAQARVFLGDCYLRLEDSKDAQPELERAVKDDSSIELGHLDLGDIYAAQGRNSAALAQYLSAAKLNPDDADPHWRLSRLYRTMGQADKSRAESALVSKLKMQSYQSLSDQISAAGKAHHEHAVETQGATQP
jgi:tetratricopeptide (TPR) repeat protein